MKKALCAGLILMFLGLISGSAISALTACNNDCGSGCCEKGSPSASGFRKDASPAACCVPADTPCCIEASNPMPAVCFLPLFRYSELFKKTTAPDYSFGTPLNLKGVFSLPVIPPAGGFLRPVPVYLTTLSLLI